jgi:hypothetical protein
MSWSTDEDSLQMKSMAGSLGDSPPNYTTTTDTLDTIEAVVDDMDIDTGPGAKSRYNTREDVDPAIGPDNINCSQ